MRKKLLTFALAAMLASCGGGGSSAVSSEESSKTATIDLVAASTGEIAEYVGADDCGTSYEVFVYSFADSNGDGIGDLKGIEGKLDYLKELGVKNVWLTPIHPSSTYHKYNVDDYYDIDTSFGTMDDFVSLCAKAKEKGIRIVMDMVFNHSSRRNQYFTQALQDYVNGNTADDSLADLYVFGDKASDVPNTSSSISYGGKTVFYECNFSTDMPEFNLDSETARNLHKDIMEFWIGKGAGGFRFDGAYYMYYGNTSKNMKYITYLSDTAKEIDHDAYLIAEYWQNSQGLLNMVAGAGMNAFNFATSTADSAAHSIFASRSHQGYDYAQAIESAQTGFLNASEGKIQPSIFLSNHDMDRWVSTFEADRYASIASMYLLTPGTPWIYYGEEIMMHGYRATASTDANRRLPMQWVADSSADTARCKPSSENDYNGDQTELGALEAIKDSGSVTSVYKDIIALRESNPALRKGIYRSVTPEEQPICAFEIAYGGKKSYLIHNIDPDAIGVNVPTGLTLSGSVGAGQGSLDGSTVTIPGYSTVYLTMEN